MGNPSHIAQFQPRQIGSHAINAHFVRQTVLVCKFMPLVYFDKHKPVSEGVECISAGLYGIDLCATDKTGNGARLEYLTYVQNRNSIKLVCGRRIRLKSNKKNSLLKKWQLLMTMQ